MLKSRCLLLIIIPFLCDTGVYAHQSFLIQHQQTFNQISSQLQHLVDNNTLDGISIGVVNQSSLIWSKSLGYANREANIEASENTVYRVGSLSKLLTASAILQLEEQGAIDIDQAITAYLPRFYYKTRFAESGVITSRQLLTHLSGLPSNINKGHWTEERFTNLVERLRTEYTSYPTDFILNYSNVGYSLLGAIIEETTGYLFEDYMQKHLLTPLQMTQSNFQPYGSTTNDAASGYKDLKVQTNLPVRDIPALGLNTSLVDMSHFVSAILNQGSYNDKRILDPDSIESMFEVQNRDIELDFDQLIGLPWFVNQIKDEKHPLIVEHGGTTINYSSQLLLAPQQQLGIIILSNTGQVNTIINNIAKQLLNMLISNSEKTIISYIPEDFHIVNTGENRKNRYIAKSGMIEIDSDTGKLCDCQANRTLNLVPLPDGWFGISPDNKQFTSKVSEKVIDGNTVIVLQKNGKQHRIGSRYQYSENRFNWEQYFGKYEIINPDEDFPVSDVRVFDEENIIYMCYRMPKLSTKLIVLPITPVSNQEAITEGLGRSKGETVYSQDIDGVTHLIYSGYIARKISKNDDGSR